MPRPGPRTLIATIFATACGLDTLGVDTSSSGDPVETSSTEDPVLTTDTSVCGDGVVAFDEDCDDGNAIETDACTTSCKPAACGDGHIQPGETCDDGNAVDDDACTNSCAAATTCGNGILDPGETCDDGNTDPTDVCTSLCQVAACGDGFILGGLEECDDGPDNADDAACTSECALATCGDGFVQSGVESCDDGDHDSTDDCTDLCQEATCGDGYIHSTSELCDDGNGTDADQCSNDCQLPRIVFIVFPGDGVGGNLGGILGADLMCKTAATDADLPGTYKAWLTDSDPNTSPAVRFGSAGFTGWYLGTDGTAIAHGWDDLVTLEDNQTDYLKAPIRSDQDGTAVGDGAYVWTNTNPDGEQNPMNRHCTNWTSALNTDKGNLGQSSPMYLSEYWTRTGYTGCHAESHLYCFQTDP